MHLFKIYPTYINFYSKICNLQDSGVLNWLCCKLLSILPLLLYHSAHNTGCKDDCEKLWVSGIVTQTCLLREIPLRWLSVEDLTMESFLRIQCAQEWLYFYWMSFISFTNIIICFINYIISFFFLNSVSCYTDL